MRAFLAVSLLTLLVWSPAHAESCWRTRYDYWSGNWVREWAPCRRYHHYAYRRSYDDGWERRDERSEYGEQCKEDHRAIGAVHLTQDGAIKSAVNQWQSEIRYDWGERFMNIDNARHYRWRCDRASTNESVAGRVGEAVAGVVGGEGYQKRCIVIAAPCRMGLKRGDEDRR